MNSAIAAYQQPSVCPSSAETAVHVMCPGRAGSRGSAERGGSGPALLWSLAQGQTFV